MQSCFEPVELKTEYAGHALIGHRSIRTERALFNSKFGMSDFAELFA